VRKKKTVIHVNQHLIRANHKTGARDSVLTVKDWKQNRKSNSVQILDGLGEVVAEVVYRPDNPLPCGARVWIQTYNEVVIDEE
jgi:hypothetical protein